MTPRNVKWTLGVILLVLLAVSSPVAAAKAPRLCGGLRGRVLARTRSAVIVLGRSAINGCLASTQRRVFLTVDHLSNGRNLSSGARQFRLEGDYAAFEDDQYSHHADDDSFDIY